MSKSTVIGLFGYGVVGQGLYRILSETNHFNAEIRKICVHDPNKERNLPTHFFTYRHEDILLDNDINLIVEVISDADAAYHTVVNALKHGKHVVTANKKMVAEHFEELFNLQEEYGGALLYEASCCGSIPIIRTLEEYFDNEPLHSVKGIFNGSSNYILSKLVNEKLDYEPALKKAQELGFAEADPSLDVEGRDALNKLCIITAHAFGIFIQPDEVLQLGIQFLEETDIAYAQARGYKIKPLAMVQEIGDQEVGMAVIPAWVGPEHDLFAVENEFNAVQVQARYAGNQLLKGKGAGGFPTGAAVLSDISANEYAYRYSYKKRKNALQAGKVFQYNSDTQLSVYLRYPKEIEGELLSYLQPEYKTTDTTRGAVRQLCCKVKSSRLKASEELLRKYRIPVVATEPALE
jgi:homoserine dehydrogenase